MAQLICVVKLGLEDSSLFTKYPARCPLLKKSHSSDVVLNFRGAVFICQNHYISIRQSSQQLLFHVLSITSIRLCKVQG